MKGWGTTRIIGDRVRSSLADAEPCWSSSLADSSPPGLVNLGGGGWLMTLWIPSGSRVTRVSGRGGQVGDLIPHGESDGHLGAVLLGGEAVTAGSKMP